MKTVTAPEEVFMNAKKANALVKSTAARGRPFFVQYVKILGACPRRARPYNTREEEKRNELPAENAEVKMHALMMCGRTLMPERVMAMT